MRIKALLPALFFVFVLSSCGDDEKEVYTQAAKDNSLSELITMDILEEVLTITPIYVIEGKYEADTTIVLSASPALSDPTYPKVITIDYHTGVTGNDGIERKGKLLVTVGSGTVLAEDISVESDGFIDRGNTVYGTIDFTYSSIASQPNYSVDLADAGLTLVSANGTMKWDGTLEVARVDGESTKTIGDDVYELSGSSSGIDLSGRAYTVSTQTNHTINFDCNSFIVQGTSSITPNEKDQHTVDYGTGSCDNNGSIKISGGSTSNFNF